MAAAPMPSEVNISSNPISGAEANNWASFSNAFNVGSSSSTSDLQNTLITGGLIALVAFMMLKK